MCKMHNTKIFAIKIVYRTLPIEIKITYRYMFIFLLNDTLILKFNKVQDKQACLTSGNGYMLNAKVCIVIDFYFLLDCICCNRFCDWTEAY